MSSFLAIGNGIDFSKTYNSHRYNFKSQLNGKVYNSEFTIFSDKNEIIYQSKFINDEALDNFKAKNNDNIIDIVKSIKLSEENTLTIVKNLDDFLESMLDDFFSELNNIKQLSFHYSILTTKNREFKTKKCECTVHPGYLTDKTAFACMEDHVLNNSKIIFEIENNSDIFNDNASRNLLIHLKKNTQGTTSFKDMYNFYYPLDKYKENISSKAATCLLGQGSSHGCCGNYSGCCYYINPICHIHDAMCSDCKPRWFCLPGCKPD